MITADTLHMSIEEARIGESIRQAGSWIGRFQLGDSNGLEPGAGHYGWAETLEALEAIGYEGWLAMECGSSCPVDQILTALVSGGATGAHPPTVAGRS